MTGPITEEEFAANPPGSGGDESAPGSGEEGRPRSSWVLPAAAAAALVVGLLGGYFGRPVLDEQLGAGEPTAAADVNPAGQPAVRPTLSPDQIAQRQMVMDTLINETRHFKGDEDAPITVIEFSDFSCGYCGRFYRETETRLDGEYIRDGQVRFGYWHFPFLGPGSQLAAEASECAGEQDAFWPYHDRLFSGEISQFSQGNLQDLAGELDLNQEDFAACLESGRHSEFVQAQRNLAQQLGVQSTPTFLINGRPVIGAQPYEVFAEIIDTIQVEDGS